MIQRWIAAASLLILPRVVFAQSIDRMLRDDLRNSARDIGAVWSAPFDASGKDWLITAAAFGAFGLSMLADQEASDWAIRNDSSGFFQAIKPLRRGGKLFSGKYVVPPVAAVYIIGLATRNEDLRDFVTGCMSSWGAQSVLRKGLYLLVGRARPDTLPDDPQRWRVPSGGSWMMHSFPAGHFANALACATYWNNRFRLGVAEPAIYALAAAVGVGRMADRAHWLSDTVLGGILGYAVGREIASRALARRQKDALNAAQLYMSPDPTGVTLGLRWTF